MEKQIDLFPHEQAEITEHGIVFNGFFYTCSIAIREQWYKEQGIVRKIPIYFDSYDQDYIFVLLNDGSLTLAFRILGSKTDDEQSVKNYQERIRYLKQQLKKRKKKH